MKCDKCGANTQGYELFDYCAICNKNLCPTYMQRGCCGNVPARSGEDEDYPSDEPEEGHPGFIPEEPDEGQAL